MLITEADLASRRADFGSGEMPFQGTEAFNAGTSLTDKYFTPSWELFKDEFHPTPERPPAESLEIVLFLAFTQRIPTLRYDYDWWGIEHQAGGHATEHFRFIGTRLTPRASIYGQLRQIARDRWHAKKGNLYRSRASARDIAAYSNALEQIGLDCDYTFPHLVESIYPIDAMQENLDRVAENAPVLRELGTGYGFRQNTNLIIVAITQNSD